MEVVTRSKRMMNLGVYSGLIQRRLISERQAFEGLVPELGRYNGRRLTVGSKTQPGGIRLRKRSMTLWWFLARGGAPEWSSVERETQNSSSSSREGTSLRGRLGDPEGET